MFNEDNKSLKKLLKDGADPNLQITDGPKVFRYVHDSETLTVGFFVGTTPLMIAGERGNLKAIRTLLHYGAMVNFMDSLGLTAFAWACASNEKAACELLLSNSALVDAKEDKGGMSPLLIASRLNLTCMARWLLSQGSNIHSRDKRGRSAMHYAAWNYNIPLMTDLYNRSTPVNTKDRNGNMPLHLLCADDKVHEPEDTDDILFSDNEHVYLDKLFKNMSSHLKQGVSTSVDIRTAVLRGNGHRAPCEEYFALKYLLSIDARHDTKNNNGETPMHILARRLPRAVVSQKYVICEYPKLNQSVIIQMVLLQLKGASPEVADKNGYTVLDICLSEQNHLAMKSLNKYSGYNMTINNWDPLQEEVWVQGQGQHLCEKEKHLEGSIELMISSIRDDASSVRDYAFVRRILTCLQNLTNMESYRGIDW